MVRSVESFVVYLFACEILLVDTSLGEFSTVSTGVFLCTLE